jgi:Cytochrome c biogenesis factor
MSRLWLPVVLLAFFLFAQFPAAAGAGDPLPLDSLRELMINGAVDQTIRSLNDSVRANPENADQYNLLCRAHYAEEQWDAAVSECERAVSINPRNSVHQLWLGRAYGEKAEHSSWFSAIGLAKKAHTAFERAVELDPSSIEARSDLSEYYIEAPGFLGGGIDKAAAQAMAVEKLDLPTAYWIRARIAEHEKRMDEAERNYKQAVEVAGNPPHRLFDLASFYRKAGRYDDVERTIQQAAKLNTRNDSGLVDSASLLLRISRNNDLAASMLRRYIEHGSRSEDWPLFRAQYLLGQVLEKSGDAAGAREAYRSSHNLASEFAPATAALKRLRAL